MNAYWSLLRENDRRVDVLPEVEYALIKRLMNYLKAVPLPATELQLMRKELIGMAEEAIGRGESLADAIGMDEPAFCMELAVNCPKRRPLEHLFYWCFTTIVSTFYVYMVLWLFSGFQHTVRLRASYLTFVALWLLFVALTNNALIRKTMYAMGYKKHLLYIGYFLVSVLITLFTSMLLKDKAGNPIWVSMTGWVVAAVLAGAALISSLVWLGYLNRQMPRGSQA